MKIGGKADTDHPETYPQARFMSGSRNDIALIRACQSFSWVEHDSSILGANRDLGDVSVFILPPNQRVDSLRAGRNANLTSISTHLAPDLPPNSKNLCGRTADLLEPCPFAFSIFGRRLAI